VPNHPYQPNHPRAELGRSYTMAAPGASIPMQGSRRSETHQQRLLEVQAQILAQNHPIIGSARGAKPAGILNEGNTCFFNSTFQALAATTSLIDLVGPVIFPAPKNVSTTIPEGDEHQSGGGPPDALDRPAHTYTAIATGSDGYPLYPHSIPSLLDAALEPEHAKLLPVTLAFEKCLGKAWKAKDEGLKNLRAVEAGDTDAERAVEKEKSLSLRTLLKELSRKYDQYDDVSGMIDFNLSTNS
jgi:ubiquitin carboxyl-terminal hydrolase 16/45